MKSSARGQQSVGEEALVIQREIQMALPLGWQFARALALAAELEARRSVQKLPVR